jgi:hypothetical protein
MNVAVPASSLASAGSLRFRVQNASGTSNSLFLTITSGATSSNAPSIASLLPASATAGGQAFVLTVNGLNFISGSMVQWNGSPRQTFYQSATQVTASITANDITSAGTAAVVVVNPPPGGGTSATATFTIKPGPPAQQNTFPPTITWMLPLTTTAGGAATTLSVFGGNCHGRYRAVERRCPADNLRQQQPARRVDYRRRYRNPGPGDRNGGESRAERRLF